MSIRDRAYPWLNLAVVAGIIWAGGKHGPAAVPCDAQAGQMQAPKLTLEQRVERLEKRVQALEEFTGELRARLIMPEDIERALRENPIIPPADKPAIKRGYPYHTDPRSMEQIQREDPELYRDIITTIPAG